MKLDSRVFLPGPVCGVQCVAARVWVPSPVYLNTPANVPEKKDFQETLRGVVCPKPFLTNACRLIELRRMGNHITITVHTMNDSGDAKSI